MPFPTTRALLGFLARFAALYALIFSLAWGLSLFRHTEAVVVAGAERQLALLEEPAILRSLALQKDGTLVQHITTSQIENYELTHREDAWVSHNWFIFLALVLASPGLAWRQRGVALAVGTVAILAVDVVIVMGVIWEGDRLFLSQVHPGISSGAMANVAYLVSALHPTGGIFMVPVFLWGFTLLAFPLFGRLATDAHAGRNAPCPCGSGDKFKRCCGA